MSQTPGGETIVLAEDEEDARFLLTSSLERAGYRVISCGDGHEACQALQQETVDLLVTDLRMPVIDGLKVLKSVRHRPLIKVVVTAFADRQGTIDALNYGADYLLEKPFTAAEFLALCARLLVERRETESRELGGMFERRLEELQLSASERRLATLVIKGAGNKRIASILGLQEQTIKNRLYALYGKLGIGSRTELVHLVFPV